jgi:hypothetical protein
MSGFIWRNRHSVEHNLATCDLIKAEIAAIDAELEAFVDKLEADDPNIWTAAMQASEPLVQRRNALMTDCERWNKHADAIDVAHARALAASIAAKRPEIDTIRILHDYLKDWEKLDRDIAAGVKPRSAIDAPMTQEQAKLLTNVLLLPASAAHSISSAHALLQADPRTNRDPLPKDANSFLAQDRHGRPYDVRDLRDIEVEYIATFEELDALVPALKGEFSSQLTAEAHAAASTPCNRLVVIQQSMEGWAQHCAALQKQEARARARTIRKLG